MANDYHMDIAERQDPPGVQHESNLQGSYVPVPNENQDFVEEKFQIEVKLKI